MFTGIIQEKAKVKFLRRNSRGICLGIICGKIYKDSHTGDSISVNGVCLTLTKKLSGTMFFDVVTSTVKKTNIPLLRAGDYVNIEPALKLGDRLGGHFLLGHIDGVLRLEKIKKTSGFVSFIIELPKHFRKNIVTNGSVGIEGVSLTVKNISSKNFTVDIIPFTYKHTNLSSKRVGSLLNVEFDYLLKREV